MIERGDELDSRGKKRSKYWSVNDEPSMTVQSDAHLADITNILKSFSAGGMQQLDDVEMQFADVSDFGDYHDVMIEVRRAETEFMKLPSKVREIFEHSVEVWLDSAHDKDKRDALVEAGFIERVEVAEKKIEEKVAGEEKAPDKAVGGESDKGSE